MESVIVKREKKKASYHAAAHAFVINRFGGQASPEIWRNSPENVNSGGKAWLGTARMYLKPGSIPAYKDLFLPVPENWRVLVGLAGVIAEHVCDGITDTNEIAISIYNCIAFNEMSRTDLDLIGSSDWGVDVDATLKILLDGWESITREATRLMLKAGG